jgi:hypothetical protein
MVNLFNFIQNLIKYIVNLEHISVMIKIYKWGLFLHFLLKQQHTICYFCNKMRFFLLPTASIVIQILEFY